MSPRGADKAVGADHAGLGRQLTEREPCLVLLVGPSQAQRELEVYGQLEGHVEELRPELEGAEVSGEMADVEAPVDGPLDLGPAFFVDLVDVGVLPQVDQGPGETAVPVEQGGGPGDRSPAIKVVLRVEGEVSPDVLASVTRRSLAHGPGTTSPPEVATPVRRAS